MSKIFPAETKFEAGYEFQRQWIERRGLFLLTAMFLGAIGGGLFILSQLFGFRLGVIIGWVIVTLGKSGFHIAFLGKPLRFLRAFLRPQSSWLSRGLIILTLFIIFGGLQAGSVLGFLPTIPSIQAIAIAMAMILVVYDGFLLASSKGIPFWNSSVMPILFFTSALVGGAGLIFMIVPFLGETAIDLAQFKLVGMSLLILEAFLILTYLWTTYHTNTGARESVRQLVRGRITMPFWVGVIIIGIAIPFAVGSTALFLAVPTVMIGIVAILEVVGDYLLKYSILKAGIHPKLI